MTDCLLSSLNTTVLYLKVFKYGKLESSYDLQQYKHFVVTKLQKSACALMPALFRTRQRPQLGLIPRSQELCCAISEMEKVIMKDLAPILPKLKQ